RGPHPLAIHVQDAMSPAANQIGPSDSSRQDSRSHREWFWGGMAVVTAILAAVLWGVLFILAEGLFVVGIYKAPWWMDKPITTRFARKAILATVIGLPLLIFWLFV